MFARLWVVCDGANGERCEVSIGKVSATTTDADPIGACCSSIGSRMPLLHFSHLVLCQTGMRAGTGGRRAVRRAIWWEHLQFVCSELGYHVL